jgi:hypothetical protein
MHHLVPIDRRFSTSSWAIWEGEQMEESPMKKKQVDIPESCSGAWDEKANKP